MQAKEVGLGYRVEWEDTLYLVPTPLVKINSQNQFHSAEAPAIRWKKASEFFYLNGVNFPKDLWKKVVSGKMPFEDILAIQDIDQRTQAMRYGDINKFFEHTKAIKLDSSSKGNKLWKIPQNAGIFTQDAYFLQYSCPSTAKEYMSGIDPKVGAKGNADEAQAWKHEYQLQEYLTLQEA